MTCLTEHFQHGTRDAQFALDRLVGVGRRAYGNVVDPV
jgi:hypothetical protein